MIKPISLLIGALTLTTMFMAAEADTSKMVTVLTLMETGKPSVSIDLSDAAKPGNQLTKITSDSSTFDANPTGTTQTTICTNNIVVTLTDRMGKRTEYKFKNGLAILTVTSVKGSTPNTVKTDRSKN